MRALLTVACVVCCSATVAPILATDVLQITRKNYDHIVPKGKEVDAIYGDWVLRNKQIVAVIANTTPGRKANMTVRGVGGMLIDFTRRVGGSDQLSCFYPAGGRYLFEDEETFVWQMTPETTRKLNDVGEAAATEVTLSVTGTPVSDDGTSARITYTLREEQDWLDYSVQLKNDSDKPRRLPIEDSLRCDGSLFDKGSLDDLRLFYAEDRFFGQCYGFIFDRGTIKVSGGRSITLHSGESTNELVLPGASVSWSGRVNCSQGLPSVRSWATAQLEKVATQSMFLKLQCPQGPVAHALVEFKRDGKSMGSIQSDDKGIIRAELTAGDYAAIINSHGREPRRHEFQIGANSRADTLSLPSASRVRAKVVDGENRSIAAKVQFIGIGNTSDPDFGPDSAIYAVKNVVYCAHGQFEQPIDPGTYQIIISHGPEYDAITKEIEVVSGGMVQFSESLSRSIDTRGWISADFHSHSSPSGDNVSHQTGRVLNLLAEHIEFAPCTEHNRIDTYADDLALLDAADAMATCTGMELTGSPLPINHQNAFPLHRHQHEQDGGGPQTDSDPVKQIERLALWDNSSEKVVQVNHPYIPQILGDRNLDGRPDPGFRGMLGWMDVIEIHPPEGLFATPTPDMPVKDKYRNPAFFWMQLLNLGYRIPGVVNTDAHYNFHGSGWLRNYIQSSTDDPSKVSMEEMILSSQRGRIVMTTGPFLQAEVRMTRENQIKSFTPGQDVHADGRNLSLWIRVQCPNWFDINRVQVFANGRPIQLLNFTRRTHPQDFGDATIRFEKAIELPEFKQDTHLIITTIGEGLKLGPVMGAQRGQLPPVAVTNPIFLDIDGSGFQPNGDDLGVPFLLP